MRKQTRAPERTDGTRSFGCGCRSIFLVVLPVLLVLVLLVPVSTRGETEGVKSKADVRVRSISVDPFVPFVEPPREEEPTVTRDAAAEGKDTVQAEPAFRTPLERVSVKELQLAGIVTGSGEKLAVVEDARGIAHDLYVGTAVGMNNGRVTEILTDRVIIEEYRADGEGAMQAERTILRIE
ncbi:MAG: hypothetical protein AVO39_04300 [delta proteobacterium MLS_D]|jgi:Tfp pilus assembly protein PilP|nr:MAG: hypothetical protein AVO39_04300 [delta proteobacterium MLS_D]